MVHQNYQLTMDWLTEAALRGSAQAQCVLGTVYEYGVGETEESFLTILIKLKRCIV